MMKRLILILAIMASYSVACAQELLGGTVPADSMAVTADAPEQQIIGRADAPTHIYTYDGKMGQGSSGAG